MTKHSCPEKNVTDIGEFGLISRLRARIRHSNPSVVTGIGDDTAVLDVAGARLLLATCDTQIDGVHFQSEVFTPEEVGARAAAVNLSDIAAMGGRPTFALVSLAVPPTFEVAFFERLYDGLQRCLGEFGAEIVGGNTAGIPERLSIDLTMLGEVTPDSVLRRSGASPGDVLCVTGALGASRAGLTLLKDRTLTVAEAEAEAAFRAHKTPRPRVREGRVLGRSGVVSSCIDISDGLLGDVHHLATSSDVTITIDAARLPVATCATAVARSLGENAARFAAEGGEDFELLFTVPRTSLALIVEQVRRETGTAVAAIGEVVAGPPEVRLTGLGTDADARKSGYDHFFAL